MFLASTMKRILPKSLLGRSLLIIIIPLILLQVVSAVIFYETHWAKITRRLAIGVAGDVAATIEIMRRDPSVEGREWAFRLAAGTLGFAPQFYENAIL